MPRPSQTTTTSRKSKLDRSKTQAKLTPFEKEDKGLPCSKPDSAKQRSRVFLVHGHDHAASYQVQNFLREVNLEVIVLKDIGGGSKTIIEKFERYSNVEFAVVVLTPDDKGGTAATGHEEQKYRARQNVIFELGFFVGKLGRNKVIALRASDVEIPSDYSGVEYITLDPNGGWRWSLARELQIAQIPLFS